ncbi:VOC family protein [uncultured Alsobacter sp.]|uniref:VOC family protein n=1 Tax=uncultured Alsobacter sp. TaxID=1748258 RepID=UPI0025E3CBB7|nr:VOC family protein [uncultured Alsobacter sp.]
MADTGTSHGPRHLALGRVVLTVKNLDAVQAFYERAVGLHVLRRDGDRVELGVGDAVLLELRRDASARVRSPREAGLFHTAFLLPSRADLGRWVKHAAATRAPVVGASDHAVSEAIYLSDPEGNGVEIYVDRPAATWRRNGHEVEMTTEQLDIDDLVAQAGARAWAGFPEGSTVGHVHLQVGAIPPAEAFYAGVLGFDLTCRYPGGSFYASDGYHHHLATNVWNSRGAGPRELPSTGLAEVEIRADRSRIEAVRQRATDAAGDGERLVLRDPWGTSVALVAH